MFDGFYFKFSSVYSVLEFLRCWYLVGIFICLFRYVVNGFLNFVGISSVGGALFFMCSVVICVFGLSLFSEFHS